MRKSNTLLLVLGATAVLLSSCGGAHPSEIVISNVGNKETIKVGETLQFNAAVLPEGSEQKVEWKVVNITGEASINESGLLSATKEGDVEVVAASYFDKDVKGTFALKISGSIDVKPTEIKLLSSKNELKIGETLQLSTRVTPANASKEVAYSTSDEGIISVSVNGTIKALKAGTAKITVTSKLDNNIKDELSFVVKEESVTPSHDWTKINVSTLNEYVEAKKDTPIKVEGKCTLISQSVNGKYNAYLHNEKGGFYLYGLDETNQVLEVNKSYVVGGIKDIYSNEHQLKNIEFIEEINKNINVLTSEIDALTASDPKKIKSYMGGYVYIKDIQLNDISINTTKGYNLTGYVGDTSVSIRIDKKLSSEKVFNEINTKLQGIPSGGIINLKAIASTFGYGKASVNLNVVSSNDIEEVQLSDKEIVKLASESLEVPYSAKVGDDLSKILPTTLPGYDGVKIEYCYDGVLVDNNGIVKDTLETKDTTIKATFTKGQESASRDVTITIFGSATLNNVHTFDLEDADAPDKYGNSATKPNYTSKEGTDDVTLGNPKATWNLRNTLIAGTNGDVHDGTFSMRSQINADPTKSARLELKDDFEFNVLEFSFATYNKDVTGANVSVSYSLDSGATWAEGYKTFVVNSHELETVRVVFKETSQKMRVRIDLNPGKGRRVNFDNIRLLK